MTIRLLSESTINRIAAGEVVERPLSIVRELVDNAFDADSHSITVEVVDGGQTLIRVLDDGNGIPSAEIELAFARHATSKLQSEEELSSLLSYGFRGEALAAIASVSRVRIKSRHRDEPAGVELELDGGEVVSRKSIAMPVGTEIAVQDLFFNTPARKKFLKTERGENTKIAAWVKANALLHPEVRIKLLSDGKSRLQLVKRNSIQERAKEIYPYDAVEVAYEEDGIEVKGYLCAPSFAKATSQALSLFVNRRLLADRAIVRAAREGFGGTIKPHQIPLGYLHLEFPPHLVDINVHPQKQEVRFWNSSRVFQIVLRAVRGAVGEFQAPIQAASWSRGSERQTEDSHRNLLPPSSPPSMRLLSTGKEKRYSPVGSSASNVASNVAYAVRSDSSVLETAVFRYQDLRYVGTVLACYLLCEYDEQLVIVDMHAAHERINYNKIFERLSSGDPQKESLLIPLSVQLDEEVVECVIEREKLLSSCGFSLRQVDATRIEVLEKPSWISLKSMKSVLLDLADEDLPTERAVEGELEKVAARLACHASVRAGDSLSRDEVYALFEAMDEAEWASACPHGRPVVQSFSRDDIERRFGRQ